MRICSTCKKKMSEGFVFDGGLDYYCSQVCLAEEHPEIIPERDYDENSDYIYWTEWEDNDKEED